MIKYDRYRKQLEKQYDHTCIISRNESYKDPINRQTKTGLVEKYRDVKCKVSKKSLSSNNQSDTTNSINYELKLFISPDVTILQGDEIEINQYGHITKCKAGEGFRYLTHQEIILNREDKA